MESYAKRLKYALELKGIGQSELAREVSKLAGRKISAQSIQHLCDVNKNAEGSIHTTLFALITEVNPVWLAIGKGKPRNDEKKMTARSYPDDVTEACMKKIDSFPTKLKHQVIGVVDTIYTLTRLGLKVDISPGESHDNFLNKLEKTLKTLKQKHHRCSRQFSRAK